MAKATWLTVVPMSGTGNATLANTGTVHKGRLSRTTLVTALATGVDAVRSYSVNQNPSAEYLNIDKATYSVGEESSTITITGKTNAPKISFLAGSTFEIPISMPTIYTANGKQAQNGENIQGDPGAADEFSFSATFTIPKNTVGQRKSVILVRGSSATVQQTATITQATSTYTITYLRGDYINTISKTTEKVNYDGTTTCTATLLANTVQYTYGFSGWYEGSTKVGSALALSLSGIRSNRTFNALGTRTLNRYTITIPIAPTGAGTTTGQGTYDYGSKISLAATPATGYTFTKWTTDASVESTNNPWTNFEILRNISVTCTFTIKSYAIGVNAAYRVNESGDFTTGVAGGTVTGGGTFNHGTSVSLKATPATGYTFVGWYEGAAQVSTAATYTFTATGARTLVGRFQRNWYTITFTAGTGGTVSPTSARVQYGGSASSTATANTGYTFSGWSNGVKTATISLTNITASAAYAASFGINTYTVSYVTSTGVSSVSRATETVEYGKNALGSTATLATGYNFDGWYNGSTKVSSALTYAPTNITTSLTLTAKATIKTFTVSGIAQYRNTDSTGDFVSGSDGGSTTGSGTYNYGTKATLTATVATGYTFLGWFNSSGTSVGTSTTYTVDSVTAAVTVYARFQKNWYTVTYSKGTGVNALVKTSERVAYNGTVTSEKAVAITGYNTPTWTLSSGTASISVSAGVATLTAVKSAVTITASASINTYVITYSKNAYINTISKTTETLNYGGTATCTATLPANTEQYTYTFDGWYEGSTKVSSTLALSVSSIASAHTYEARGIRTINRYTVTSIVEPTGAGTTTGQGTYDYGTDILLKAIPSTGYTFSKWINEYDGEFTENPTPVRVLRNRTIRCIFTTNLYTVTYSKGTGIASISRTTEAVAYGENALGSTATLSAGYTFDGWYNGSTKVSSSLTYGPTNVTTNMTLTAKATLNAFTVTYQAGTGVSSVSRTSESVNYGSNALGSTATVTTGYNFDGWYNGSTRVSTSVTYAPTNVTGSMTLVAKGTLKTFTVTYTKGTGVASLTRTSETVNYGANALGSTASLTVGYNFDGWFSGSSRVSSSLTYAPTNITSNITYTAQAVIQQFTVTLTNQYRTGDNTGSWVTGNVGGTTTGGGTYAYNTSVTVKATPTTGYTFVEWYSSTGSVSTSPSYTFAITENKSLSARFQRNWFTLSYAAGDYVSSVSRTSERVEYGKDGAGSIMTINATTAQYSYAVDGWYEGATKIVSALTIIPTAITTNHSYTAKATRTLRAYTVTYVKGDYINTISRASESVNYGSNALGSTAATLASNAQYTYTFDGWYNGSTRVSTALTYAPTNITGALTLTAKATRTVRIYTVTVKVEEVDRGNVTIDGISTGSSITRNFDYGTVLSIHYVKLAIGTNDVFDGWYNGSTKLSSNVDLSYTVTGQATIVAKVKFISVSPTSVSVGANGGSASSLTVTTSSGLVWKVT